MPDEPVVSSTTTTTEPVTSTPSGENTAPPPPADSAPATTSGTPKVETAPDSDSGNKPRGDAESRIKQLTAKSRDLERRLADYERGPVRDNEPQAPNEPQIDNFPTIDAFDAAYKKYTKDLVRHETQKAVQEDRRARQEAADHAEINRRNAEAAASWNKRIADTLKRFPQFNAQAAIQAVQPNQAADGFIVDSEIGPDLLRHLAEHPDDAERIRDLGPYATVRELTRLETQLLETIKVTRPKSGSRPPQYVSGTGSIAPVKTAAEILYGRRS